MYFIIFYSYKIRKFISDAEKVSKFLEYYENIFNHHNIHKTIHFNFILSLNLTPSWS